MEFKPDPTLKIPRGSKVGFESEALRQEDLMDGLRIKRADMGIRMAV